MSTFPESFPTFHRHCQVLRLDYLKLFVLLLVLGKIELSQGVEFSQFHLPPCCYIPGGPHFGPGGEGGPLVASSPSEQNGTITSELPHIRSISSGEIYTSDADTNQVYKLIVPLKFPSSKAAEASLSFLRPPPEIPSQLLPISRDKLKKVDIPEDAPPNSITIPTVTSLPEKSTSTLAAKSGRENDSVNDAAGSERYNVFLLRELGRLNKLTKVQEHPIPQDAPSSPAPQTVKEETVLEKIARLGFSVSNRLQRLSTKFQSMAETTSPSLYDSFQNSHGPYQMYKTFVKRQVTGEPPMKMPSLWVKNLRKALYQSLSAKREESSESPSTAMSNPGQLHRPQPNNKVLWKNLKAAKLKFIDLASEATSDLPEEIFLPTGQGPIVSGVATLARTTGNLEIRIPSKLYNIPEDSHGSGSGEGAEFCKCSLIGDGDMVLAYWSISRIIADDGLPALQYLVFPHPQPFHTVNLPSPPQMIPFRNDYDFKPSPIDLLPNHLNEISNGRGYHRHKPSVVIDARRRTPKYNGGDHYFEGPGPHLPPPHYQGIIPIDHLNRGVPIDHNGKYTDDFLSLYRAAIDHHFQNIDSMKSVLPVGNGYFENLIHERYPIQPTPAPPLAPIAPPHGYQGIPFGYGHVPPPSSIPGIATPVQSLQPTPHDDHPKSIQDIISPYAPPPLSPGPHVALQYPYNINKQQQGHGIIHDGGLLPEDPRYNKVSPNIRHKYNNDNRRYNSNYDEKDYERPNSNRPRPHHNSYPQRYGGSGKRYHIRDEPKKYAYTKDQYYDDYKASGIKNKFAHRVGEGTANKLGGILNDIDNPDGYILDFK